MTSGHSIVELIAPKNILVETLQEIALPSEKNINVIAIKSERLIVTENGENTIEKRINDLPGANDIVHEGDVLILLGPRTELMT